MSGKRFTEEFKEEAFKKIIEGTNQYRLKPFNPQFRKVIERIFNNFNSYIRIENNESS